jgi:hypothetical protein
MDHLTVQGIDRNLLMEQSMTTQTCPACGMGSRSRIDPALNR